MRLYLFGHFGFSVFILEMTWIAIRMQEICSYKGRDQSVFFLTSEVDSRTDRVNPLSAGDAFKRIHTVFPQLKFDRN